MPKIICLLSYLLYFIGHASGATIAIIDTGFDLDHDFLRPKILKQETDEEAVNPSLKEFQYWNFHDNSHLKKPVTQDQSQLQEILLYRNLRAKGHREGLSLEEFEWFKKRSSDKDFMVMVKNFKKHSHGTFVAGIALREGENINLFPIRGLGTKNPVVAVDDPSTIESVQLKGKTPEEKFKESIKNSQDRVIKKFSKICHYLAINKIDIVNASYGITYKNITTRIREKYKEFTEQNIDELTLQIIVKNYFDNIQRRTQGIIEKYPKMLFVFSAGNSGIDNDLFPHYPSKIKLPNTLAVGAMNGEYLASFSNYGLLHVDIGAPGVAILSLVPKVYSLDGRDIYSPSSGTSMAAPYISNLAAQILNINNKLRPEDIKKIILQTGDVKEHLKTKMISGALVNNEKAIKAALLSRDMPLDQAINLAKSGLIPMEDSISLPQAPAIRPREKKVKAPSTDANNVSPPTSEGSLQSVDQEKDKPDNLTPPPSTDPAAEEKSSDLAPSNQSEEQSLPLSEGQIPSSSPPESKPLPTQNSDSVPSAP